MIAITSVEYHQAPPPADLLQKLRALVGRRVKQKELFDSIDPLAREVAQKLGSRFAHIFDFGNPRHHCEDASQQALVMIFPRLKKWLRDFLVRPRKSLFFFILNRAKDCLQSISRRTARRRKRVQQDLGCPTADWLRDNGYGGDSTTQPPDECARTQRTHIDAGLAKLAKRDQQIALSLGAGYSREEIAMVFDIGARTVGYRLDKKIRPALLGMGVITLASLFVSLYAAPEGSHPQRWHAAPQAHTPLPALSPAIRAAQHNICQEVAGEWWGCVKRSSGEMLVQSTHIDCHGDTAIAIMSANERSLGYAELEFEGNLMTGLFHLGDLHGQITQRYCRMNGQEVLIGRYLVDERAGSATLFRDKAPPPPAGQAFCEKHPEFVPGHCDPQ